MQLSEKIILRRYHALDYDWTPLSRNPCWLSNAAHHFHAYMKRNRFVWFHRLVIYRQKLLPTNYKLTRGNDKSFADDLVESGYCKCESSLCATIHWDFSRVATICSSLFWNAIGDLSSSWSSVDRLIFLRSPGPNGTRFFTDNWDSTLPSQSTRFHSVRQRPYRNEYTRSLPNSEVNRRRARIVLRWGTAREVLRVLLALFFFPKILAFRRKNSFSP